MKKILIVEDNEDIADILMRRVAASGFSAELVRDGMSAIARLLKQSEMPDAIILDLMMPGRTGHDLLNSIKCTWSGTKIFIFSAHAEYKHRIPGEDISGFFCKTDGVDQLISAIQKSIGN